MVVLDSFPFVENSDFRHSGSLRRNLPVSGGHSVGAEVHDAMFVGSENFVSNVADQNGDVFIATENSVRIVEPVGRARGYMEGVENSKGYLKCRLCHYQTKIDSLFRRHVVKHSLDSDFRCPACEYRESDPCKFVDHIGTHQSGKLVRCCFCPKKMSRGKLKSHIRIHRAVEMYDCSMCQFSTNYEKTIKSHMDVYHTKEHACAHCNVIMTKHELHWHMKFKHSVEPVETGESKEMAVPTPVPAGRGTNTKTIRFPTKPIPNQSIFSRKFGASKISHKSSIASKLQKHATTKTPFKCGKCDYKTPYKKLIRAHRAKHLLDNALVCTKCGFKEDSNGKFAMHLTLHSPTDSLECCFCGFQTPNRWIMANHVGKHKAIPMFDCSECEFSAKRPSSVRNHTANVHRKKSVCKACGVEMSRFAMSLHKKECRAPEVPHDEQQGPSSPVREPKSQGPEASSCIEDIPPKDENTMNCEYCLKPYSKSYLRKHLKRCPVETIPASESGPIEPKGAFLESQSTGVSFANKYPETLSRNRPEDHPELGISLQSKPSRKNSIKKPYLRCSSCVFKTKKKQLLKKHVVKHLIDFRFTCPECGHKEMNASRFVHHILEHGSDAKTFQCCFCSMTSSLSKKTFAGHMELHRPVNIFDCPDCDYSSNRAGNVRGHWYNNHSKNRKCKYCGEIMSKIRLTKHLLECRGGAIDESLGLSKTDDAVAVETSPSHESSHPNVNLDGLGQWTTQRQLMKDNVQEPTVIGNTALAILEPPQTQNPTFEIDQDFLKCTTCSYRSKIQSLMDRHVAKHLQDVPFVCPLCGFEHLNSRKFANHWDKHECNTKKFYQCCFCDVIVKKKHCLKGFLPQHIEEHRAVTLQDCSDCEFSSHSSYELGKHYKNQHLKKCECLLCGEVMTVFEHSFHTECKGVGKMGSNDRAGTASRADPSVELSDLRQHSAEAQRDSQVAASEDQASSVDPSPLAEGSNEARPELPDATQYMQCSTCNYATQSKSLFERHVLKHLLDVPFSCKLCPFSCCVERTFAEHTFAHSGSHKCQFCSHKPSNIGAAARHLSSHKVLAIHDCPKCEFTSKYMYRLADHLKGKHLDVPRCSYCGMKMSKSELPSHERECSRSLRCGRFDGLDLAPMTGWLAKSNSRLAVAGEDVVVQDLVRSSSFTETSADESAAPRESTLATGESDQAPELNSPVCSAFDGPQPTPTVNQELELPVPPVL